MSKTTARLEKYFSEKGEKVSVVERTIGRSNGSLSIAFKRQGSITSEVLELILEHYPINPVWLLTGKGPMELGAEEDFQVMEAQEPYTAKDPTAELLQAQRELIAYLKEHIANLSQKVDAQQKTNHHIGMLLSKFEKDIAKLKNPSEASFENLAFSKMLREFNLLA